jgi:predicted GNAT family N-acyltransferase
MNRECFPEEGNVDRLDPETDEEEYLLLSGKKVGGDDKDFVWEGKRYKITCMMTVVVKKTFNDIWNVCTPTSQRKQGYLGKLFEYYWKEIARNRITTRLYVVLKNNYLLDIYQKFGFKWIRQSTSVHTMERKFKTPRSVKQTKWKSKSRKR